LDVYFMSYEFLIKMVLFYFVISTTGLISLKDELRGKS